MKIMLWAVGVLVVLGAAFLGLNAYIYDEKQGDGDQASELAPYFAERMIALGVADVGQPIEGFDANLLMMAYPALEPSDFQGVEAYEGQYEVRGGDAVFVRDQGEPFTSAAQTISSEGYATLLENVSARLSFPTYERGDVDELIARINTSERIETRIDQGASALNVKVVPLAVLEDSRCPADVECVQAGTVRVRVQLESGLGTATQIFTLDQPITTEAEEVTLVQVAPNAEAGKTIALGEYVFIFKIAKRTDM